MLSSCKYCVVIPHRNVPELLVKCLKSIPELLYVHVLVVDNSDEDKRVPMDVKNASWGFGGLTVIEREPRNIGYIRNEALRYLRENRFSGKLVFADADDYFTPNAIECFECFKEVNYDLVWFGVEGRDERGNTVGNADFIKHSINIYRNSNDDGALRYNCGPVWGKFIDFGLIVNNDLRFQEIETCEDTFFSIKLGFFAKRIFVSDIPLYVYVQREDSIVMTLDQKKFKTGFWAAYNATCWLVAKGCDRGYYWTQYNVVWHWMNWSKKDLKGWLAFLKVLKLCDKRSAIKGARKVARFYIKTIIGMA